MNDIYIEEREQGSLSLEGPGIGSEKGKKAAIRLLKSAINALEKGNFKASHHNNIITEETLLGWFKDKYPNPKIPLREAKMEFLEGWEIFRLANQVKDEMKLTYKEVGNIVAEKSGKQYSRQHVSIFMNESNDKGISFCLDFLEHANKAYPARDQEYKPIHYFLLRT